MPLRTVRGVKDERNLLGSPREPATPTAVARPCIPQSLTLDTPHG